MKLLERAVYCWAVSVYTHSSNDLPDLIPVVSCGRLGTADGSSNDSHEPQSLIDLVAEYDRQDCETIDDFVAKVESLALVADECRQLTTATDRECSHNESGLSHAIHS